MYKFKKGISLVIALSMVAALGLSGCGEAKDPGAASTSVSTATESATPTVVAQEPYEVNYYYVSGGAQPNNEKIETAANKYLKEELGMNSTLKLNCLDWGTYDQKLRAMLAASEYVDILWSTDWAINTFDRARDGSFLELGSLLENAPKLKAEFGDLLDRAKIDGKYYVIPQKKETTTTHSIIYNKTLADKYGIDMSDVTSMETLEPKLKLFHEKEPKTAAWHGAMGFAYTTNLDKIGFGVLENGKFIATYKHPAVRANAMLLNKWAKLGYIAKDAATKDAGPIIESGAVFAYAEGNGAKPGYAEEKNAQFKYVTATIPVAKPFTGTSSIFGSVTAISRSSKDPARAMQVLEAINTDKYLTNLISFGLENENYKKLDENTIELIPDTGYAPGVSWEIGNRSLNYLTATEPKNLYEMYVQGAKDAELSQMLGFVPNYEKVATEKAALDNVNKEYTRALQAGLVDEARYDEMIKKLETAGLDKVIAEVQTQYDAWKAKQ